MTDTTKHMKIAILGAPGSGKTKIARKAINLLNTKYDRKWGAVDGYVDELTKITGMDFGFTANFAQNLSVITARWVKEAEYYNKSNSTITCGSFYESFLYASFTTMLTSPNETAMLRDDMLNQVNMQALGSIEKTTYDYDAMFLLRYNQQTWEAKADTWDQVVDAKIPEVLDGFGKNIILLDQKTDKAKAETIVEVVGKIDDYYASLITEDDEQAV